MKVLRYKILVFFRLSEDFSGASTMPFSREITQVLMSPVVENDVEIKPDGKMSAVMID